jgi:hypothetical protein
MRVKAGHAGSMATLSDSPPELLTDAEVEAFRALARENAGAALTAEEAQAVAGQLLRILATVRATARSSTVSASPVDEQALPESPA